MIKVGFVRGKYLNNFEAQNYEFNSREVTIEAIASLSSIHRNLPWSVIRLPSVADISKHKIFKYVSNRVLGDSQVLFGLEKYTTEFDIFHTADPHYYYSYQLAKLRKKGMIKRLISTSWETIPFNNESVKRKKFIKRFAMNNTDLFLCHTDKAKKCLIMEGVPARKIRVVRLGVDIKRFNAKRLTLKRKTVTLLFVGRLVEEKGVMDLYEAFKKINSQKLQLKNVNIKLRIIGDGALKEKLLRMIEKDKFKDSVSIEQKTYEQMPRVYQAADIFVLPSKRTKTWEEQYGMSFIEAMASALAIVTYDTGAISEVVGTANVILSQGDIEALTNSINKLVSNEALRLKIGTMNRRRAISKFNSSKTAREIEAIYYEVIRSNSY